MTLLSADKLSGLTIQGEPYPTSEGDAYVSLAIKLVNEGASTVNPALEDYLRLQDEGSLFAPGFTNAGVVVPAESTIYDQVAFAVPADRDSFSLRVGLVGSPEEEYEYLELLFN